MPQPTNATTQVDLHPKLHNVVFDLQAYGAVGDNATDNKTPFTNAITDALVNGGDLYVPPATADYYVSDNLTIPVGSKPFRLRGFSTVASRIRFAANKGFIIGDNSALTHYLDIRDIGIRRSTADSTPLLDLNKLDQFTLFTVAVTGGSVDMDGCITGKLIGSEFNTAVASGDALKATNCDQIVIGGNTFESPNTAKHMNFVSGNKAISIFGNVFSTCERVCEIGTGTNTEFAIVGNSVENAVNGMRFNAGGVGMTRSVVVGNTLRGTAAGGSFGMDISSANTDLVISGNLITNFTTLIQGTPGANVEITGNPGVVDLRQRADVIATASLPAAGAAQDGRIVIEDNGTGDRNLILYAGGQRFRIDGGANV